MKTTKKEVNEVAFDLAEFEPHMYRTVVFYYRRTTQKYYFTMIPTELLIVSAVTKKCLRFPSRLVRSCYRCRVPPALNKPWLFPLSRFRSYGTRPIDTHQTESRCSITWSPHPTSIRVSTVANVACCSKIYSMYSEKEVPGTCCTLNFSSFNTLTRLG